jgi:hypothetical protein
MANSGLDEATLKAAIAKAREAAAVANAVEPRAESAYYDKSSDRIVINLKSGATFSFPPDLAQGLAGAFPDDLAEVEVTPSGDGLHWEKLDADFSVPALLAGAFGTAAWMMAQINLKRSSEIAQNSEQSEQDETIGSRDHRTEKEQTFIKEPGEIAQTSGQYEIIDSRGGRIGQERTVTKGEPLPPTPKQGQYYKLVDPTKRKGSSEKRFNRERRSP